MPHWSLLRAGGLAAALTITGLTITIGGAQAFDDATYIGGVSLPSR
jgi:hypothetical protein